MVDGVCVLLSSVSLCNVSNIGLHISVHVSFVCSLFLMILCMWYFSYMFKCFPFFFNFMISIVSVVVPYVYTVFNTVRPRFTNASNHEKFGLRTNFPNTKRLGWLLCLELRTRKPSTSWSDNLGESASAVFVEEWCSGKYPESATPIGESVSCSVPFVHSNSHAFSWISVCFVFFYKLLNGTSWGQRKTMIAAKWKEKIPISKLSFRLYLICLVLYLSSLWQI
jgi:hypothetical protein